MRWIIAAALWIIALSVVAPVYTAGPPEENIRQAYRMILAQADANKDEKLSVTECMAIYKDKSTAEKNCMFWDVDQDGIITEDEYVKQALNIAKKK
jgi:hypothetical protein